jgi:hypothetical protein
MTRIYALVSGQLVLYVGQTRQTLKRREYEHRRTRNTACSKHIPKDMEWEMKILEECEDDIATMREQYYYDTLKPFYNNNRPGQTPKESKRKYLQTEAGKEYKRKKNKRYRAKKKAEERLA